MNDPTSPKAISDLVLLSRCRAAEALGLNLSPSEVMTLAALAAERDRLAARLEKAEEDCAMFAAANARQAMCISYTAANLGPEEYSATVEGLPKAARHVAAENERLREAVAEVDRLRDALTSVLSWHDKDKHASGKMTFERSAAFAKARAALAAFKGGADG